MKNSDLKEMTDLSQEEMKQVTGAEAEAMGKPCDPYASYDYSGHVIHPCQGKKTGDSCSYYRCNSRGEYIYKSGRCGNNGGAYEFICAGS